MPRHVIELLTNMRSARQTKSDLLAALLYIVALESGFVPIAYTADSELSLRWDSFFNIQILEALGKHLPSDYRNEDISSYQVHLKLLLFPSSRCMLLARETNDSLCITLNWNSRFGKSVYLPVSRYILRSNLKEPSKCFQNTRELAYKLKEQLFDPIRNVIFEDAECKCNFLRIPLKVFWKLFSYLDAKSLQNLSLTCSFLRLEVMGYTEKSKRTFYESKNGLKLM